MPTFSRRQFLKFSALTALSFTAAALPKPTLAAAEPQALFSTSLASNKIALTFDDGYVNVNRLLDVCRAADVRVTLFPIGKLIAARPAVWKRAVDEGHEIGCHTYSHSALGGQPYEVVARELEQFMSAARQHLGLERVAYFRPPYGSGWKDEAVQKAAKDFGMSVIMWNRTNEAKKINPKPLAKDVLENFKQTAQAGDIFLYHFHWQEVAALKNIVAYCRAQNWQVSKISGMLG